MSLAFNRYGKSQIRLVKVRRDHEPHDIVDLTLDVQLEGAFVMASWRYRPAMADFGVRARIRRALPKAQSPKPKAQRQLVAKQ